MYSTSQSLWQTTDPINFNSQLTPDGSRLVNLDRTIAKQINIFA